jgi:hypothetical protein
MEVALLLDRSDPNAYKHRGSLEPARRLLAKSWLSNFSHFPGRTCDLIITIGILAKAKVYHLNCSFFRTDMPKCRPPCSRTPLRHCLSPWLGLTRDRWLWRRWRAETCPERLYRELLCAAPGCWLEPAGAQTLGTSGQVTAVTLEPRGSSGIMHLTVQWIVRGLRGASKLHRNEPLPPWRVTGVLEVGSDSARRAAGRR